MGEQPTFRDHAGEPRLPAAIAVVPAIARYTLLPNRLLLGPRYGGGRRIPQVGLEPGALGRSVPGQGCPATATTAVHHGHKARGPALRGGGHLVGEAMWTR